MKTLLAVLLFLPAAAFAASAPKPDPKAQAKLAKRCAQQAAQLKDKKLSEEQRGKIKLSMELMGCGKLPAPAPAPAPVPKL